MYVYFSVFMFMIKKIVRLKIVWIFVFVNFFELGGKGDGILVILVKNFL